MLPTTRTSPTRLFLCNLCSKDEKPGQGYRCARGLLHLRLYECESDSAINGSFRRNKQIQTRPLENHHELISCTIYSKSSVFTE